MNTITPAQHKALHAACTAILEAVAAAGDHGAPAGVLYAALMQFGCTLNQFQSITDALVHTGKLTRDGDLFTIPGVTHE